MKIHLTMTRNYCLILDAKADIRVKTFLKLKPGVDKIAPLKIMVDFTNYSDLDAFYMID